MRRRLLDRVAPRRAPSERVGHALLGVTAIVLAVGFVRPINDPDTFWHVAAGHHLLESGAFAGADPWSATATRPWVLHEWLPEVVMAFAERIGGPHAVAWLLPVSVVALAAVLYAVCRRVTSPVLAGLITVLSIGGMGASLSLRPHLVSFALAAVTAAAWLASIRDGRARWWLIPLTWVWAVSHGMWFISVAVGGAVVVGLLLNRLLLPGARADRRFVRDIGRLALVPIGCLLAAMVTPVGPSLVLAPFTVREYARFVAEWRPPQITDPWLQIFLVMLVAVLATWLIRAWRSRQPVDLARIALLVCAVAAGLVYLRTIAVGVALLVPLLAEASSHWGLARKAVNRREMVTLLAAAGVGLVVAGVATARIEPLVRNLPTSLDATLAGLPNGTVICNDYAQGGWLVWAHPHLRPVVDGRAEIYSTAHIEDYLRFAGAGHGWERFVERTGCTYALLVPHSTPLARLQSGHGWTIVGTAPEAVLIRAPR